MRRGKNDDQLCCKLLVAQGKVKQDSSGCHFQHGHVYRTIEFLKTTNYVHGGACLTFSSANGVCAFGDLFDTKTCRNTLGKEIVAKNSRVRDDLRNTDFVPTIFNSRSLAGDPNFCPKEYTAKPQFKCRPTA